MNGGIILPPSPNRVLCECSDCQGEGVIYWQGGPGVFDPGFGNYLPSEGRSLCPVCDGAGELVVELCPICQEQVDNCMCCEDDFEAFYAALDEEPTIQEKAA